MSWNFKRLSVNTLHECIYLNTYVTHIKETEWMQTLFFVVFEVSICVNINKKTALSVL